MIEWSTQSRATGPIERSKIFLHKASGVASSANGSSSLTSPRCPATSVTGMPSRRSSAGSGAHRQHPRSLHHRCRLSQPQRPARSQVQDLPKRPNRRVTPRIKRESNGGPPSSQSLQGDITAWAAASPRQASTSPTPHSLPPAKIALKPSSSRLLFKKGRTASDSGGY
jgi:hypothetical protein